MIYKAYIFLYLPGAIYTLGQIQGLETAQGNSMLIQ